MTDHLTPEKRSWNMSRIRSKDTKPEQRVRSLLWAMGYRYRLKRKGLPCKPDIILGKLKTVIFVHGCFWHRHPGCKGATTPKTRTEFWQNKFNTNVERDKRNQAELEALGWKVITIWECETRDLEVLEKRLIHALEGSGSSKLHVPNCRDAGNLYELDEGSEMPMAAEPEEVYGRENDMKSPKEK